MNNVNLSKDADLLICLIYKYYLELHDIGFSKADAKLLGSSNDIFEKITPEWNFEDVDDTCRELDKAGLLSILYADDICYVIYLTDEAIIYMENRFANKLKNLLDYIDKIKFW